MATCYCTKQECQQLSARISALESALKQHINLPVPGAHKLNLKPSDPPPPLKDDYCTKAECREIRDLATTALREAADAKRKVLELKARFEAHISKAIPEAHAYKPKVKVDISGAASANNIKLFSSVTVDGVTANDSATFKLNPTVKVDFSLAASSNGTLKGFSKVCIWDTCASDTATVKLPIRTINTPTPPTPPPVTDRPSLPNLPTPPRINPTVPVPTLPTPTPTRPTGVGGGGANQKTVSCNLSAKFNPSTCILYLTLTVDKCSRTVQVNMLCKDYTQILNRIANDLTLVKSQFNFTEPVVIGECKDPEEVGEWYDYDIKSQSVPTSLPKAIKLLSQQIEGVHKDACKGVIPKGKIDSLPTPIKCTVNPTTGDLQLGRFTTQEMGFGTAIPWLGKNVLLPYLTDRITDYLINYLDKFFDNSTQTKDCLNLKLPSGICRPPIAGIDSSPGTPLAPNKVTYTLDSYQLNDAGTGYARDNQGNLIPITIPASNIEQALQALNTNILKVWADVCRSRLVEKTLPEFPNIYQCDDGGQVKALDTTKLESLPFYTEYLNNRRRVDTNTGNVTTYAYPVSYITYLVQNLQDKVQPYQQSLTLDVICEGNDCFTLIPDPSTTLNTKGAFLLFSWVLESSPNVTTYQTTSQLRNPIDALRTINPSINYWEEYFEPVYKILGNQWGSYFSEQNTKEPLVKGWFFNEAEATRFFTQMQELTKDTPKLTDNPRFPKVNNSSAIIKNSGEKIILRKVCYGTYINDEFTAIHSWSKPRGN